jgi:ankyrin repeat protein
LSIDTPSEILENEELARWFLDEGADPNLGAPTYGMIERDSPAIPNSGQALNSAACLPDYTMFDLLVERGAKLENCIALHYAAGSSRSDLERISMVEHLIYLGFDVNELDDISGPYKFGTPLHHAVRNKKLESIRFLLERGADPHLQNQ